MADQYKFPLAPQFISVFECVDPCCCFEVHFRTEGENPTYEVHQAQSLGSEFNSKCTWSFVLSDGTTIYVWFNIITGESDSYTWHMSTTQAGVTPIVSIAEVSDQIFNGTDCPITGQFHKNANWKGGFVIDTHPCPTEQCPSICGTFCFVDYE
jgi:hypothetical protein